MTDPLLPRVGTGRDEDNRPVVCQTFRLTDDDGRLREVSLVLRPRDARVHAALILRQAQIAEEAERAGRPILRVLP